MIIIALSILSIPRYFHSDHNKESKMFFLFIIAYFIILSFSLCSPQCQDCGLNNCLSCLPGYYPQKQLCLACKQGCQICKDGYSCLNCLEGYKYDNKDGQCFSENCSQISNCATCINQTCLNCWLDYNLQAGWCFKKQIQNNVSTLGVILSISLSLSTVVIIICCIAACARKRTQQTEEVQRIETAVNIHRQPLKPIRNERNVLQKSPKEWLILIELYNSSEPCCICLDNDTQILTSCDHYFHQACLYDWSMKQAQCPYCRTKQIYPIRYICCSCHETYFETGRHEVEIRPLTLRYCSRCSNI